MNLVFCTTEVHPFSHVGGLADFSNYVPRLLTEKGIHVTIITPLYQEVRRSGQKLEPLSDYPSVRILIGPDPYDVQFHRAMLPGTTIPVLFVQCDPFFVRDGIYTNPADGQGFTDNHRRFVLFQEAILHLIQMGVVKADLVHVNDHHTALIPALIRSRRARTPAFQSLRTLLTIHNVIYQTDCEESFAYLLGLDEGFFQPTGPYVRNSRLNFLKSGILTADKVVAVSPTYAQETRSDNIMGYGLAAELASRGDDYLGILNGVDYANWSPDHDALIEKPYTFQTISNKRLNKEKLLAISGLDTSNLELPTLGMITKLTDAKGIDLLTGVFEKLLTLDLNVVLVGTGETKYHKLFESFQMRFPHKLGLHLTYNNKLAHRVLAGSDFFLMPSRFEPCGQHQMYAMRYGTVPIVRATGGLADTVLDASDDGEVGTGFSFNEYDPQRLLKTIQRAVYLYRDKRVFSRIIERAMKQDHSWAVCAGRYLDLYRTLTDG